MLALISELILSKIPILFFSFRCKSMLRVRIGFYYTCFSHLLVLTCSKPRLGASLMIQCWPKPPRDEAQST